MKKITLLPLAFVLLISGCTIPGTGITIPFLGGPTYENDVIIIKSLQAIPQTVAAGQELKLTTYIQNIGNLASEINVDLYDYCDLFNVVDVKCPGKEKGDTKCTETSLLPGEIVQIDWFLKPKEVALRTECELKVAADYSYTTKSLTSVHFINYEEMQRQLELGTFQEVAAYMLKGEGPIKAYLVIKDKQPIPIPYAGEPFSFNVELNVENLGSGFIPEIGGETMLEINTDLPEDLQKDDDACASKFRKEPIIGIKLIGKSAPGLPCKIKVRGLEIPKSTTKQMSVTADYSYEIRKSTRVSVSP